MSVISDVHEDLVAAGAIDSLLRATEVHLVTSIHRLAFCALRSMSETPHLVPQMVAKGAIPVVIRSIRQLKSVPDALQESASFLELLAKADAVMVAEAGGIQALVEALKCHITATPLETDVHM